MKSWILICCGLLAAGSFGAVAAEHGSAHKKAHVHGEAAMRLAVEGGEVSFRMGGALDNFLPFEHFPKTDEQRQAVAGLRSAVEAPAALVEFPAAAGCKRLSHSADSKIFGAEPYSGHSDLVIRQTYTCAQPEALKTVTVTAMKTFPRMKKVDAQAVGPSGAQALTLTPSASTIRP